MVKEREHQEIGAYEAKTHLPRMLREVTAGGRFRITQRGKPVADLVPIQQVATLSPEDVARRMRAFAARRSGRTDVVIRDLIEEGRD